MDETSRVIFRTQFEIFRTYFQNVSCLFRIELGTMKIQRGFWLYCITSLTDRHSTSYLFICDYE